MNADLFNLAFRKLEYVDKHQLLRRLDKAWAAFKDSYAGLSESDVLEPGVTKVWSARDIKAVSVRSGYNMAHRGASMMRSLLISTACVATTTILGAGTQSSTNGDRAVVVLDNARVRVF